MKRLTERQWTTKDNSRPTVEIKSCAHCGFTGNVSQEPGGVRVICNVCGIQTKLFPFYTMAIESWNRRVNE